MPIQLCAPCLFGIEKLVANELERMEATNVRPENGRVFFEGDISMIARANICSRYSERILIVLGRFSAYTFDELFERTRALSWEQWIGRFDAFPVKGRSLDSKLHSVPDCQKIIKKAIATRLSQKYSLAWLEETGEIKQVQFLIIKDNVCLMIDTSGDGLHKRGYRRKGAIAPIKETLAAAMDDIAYVRSWSHVVDPCCGTGTLLIEGALKALNIAPGIKRSFACEGFPEIGAGVFRTERGRALDLVKLDAEYTACGYDIDQTALEIARGNARIAGVEKRITFEKRDIRDFVRDGEKGVVVCNPPYGERLLEEEEAAEISRIMGEVFQPDTGWSYAIISPDEEFETHFGRKADKRRKLYNGMIKCQLFMYNRLDMRRSKR